MYAQEIKVAGPCVAIEKMRYGAPFCRHSTTRAKVTPSFVRNVNPCREAASGATRQRDSGSRGSSGRANPPCHVPVMASACHNPERELSNASCRYNSVLQWGMQTSPLSIRLEASVRESLERAAAEQGVGISTFIAELVRRWEKADRTRRFRESVERVMASPGRGELTDDPADWCPAVAALGSRNGAAREDGGYCAHV